jgi:hypothetical protein
VLAMIDLKDKVKVTSNGKKFVEINEARQLGDKITKIWFEDLEYFHGSLLYKGNINIQI